MQLSVADRIAKHRLKSLRIELTRSWMRDIPGARDGFAPHQLSRELRASSVSAHYIAIEMAAYRVELASLSTPGEIPRDILPVERVPMRGGVSRVLAADINEELRRVAQASESEQLAGRPFILQPDTEPLPASNYELDDKIELMKLRCGMVRGVLDAQVTRNNAVQADRTDRFLTDAEVDELAAITDFNHLAVVFSDRLDEFDEIVEVCQPTIARLLRSDPALPSCLDSYRTRNASRLVQETELTARLGPVVSRQVGAEIHAARLSRF